MNHILFAQYVPAINAYINHSTDKALKTWRDVVIFFFELNQDEEMNEVSDLAMAFKYASHPHYFSVSVNSINKYFNKKISSAELIKKGFVKEVDFVEPSDSVRLTFKTFRRLVFTQEDDTLIDAFGFVESIYNMYRRYMIQMITRSKAYTHWALIEKIVEPTKTQLINGADGNQKVLMVVKGSYKTVASKMRLIRSNQNKYEEGVAALELEKSKPKAKSKKTTKATTTESKEEPKLDAKQLEKLKPKFDTKYFTPIMEVVADCFESEIHDIITYIEENRLKPFKQEQVDTNEVDKIKDATNNIKCSKTCFLLSLDQADYEDSDLLTDIHNVRRMIQRGETIHNKPMTLKKYLKKTKKDTDGTVSIDFFTESKGEFMDKGNLCELSKPLRDDIAILMSEFEEVDIDEESDIIDDDSEGSDMDIDDE